MRTKVMICGTETGGAEWVLAESGAREVHAQATSEVADSLANGKGKAITYNLVRWFHGARKRFGIASI